MAKALAFAAGLAVACLTGCSPFGGGNFTCDTDDKCRPGGMCQPNGFCTFADGSCTSGQRYEPHSGNNSDICLGEEPIPGEAGAETQVGPACFGDPSGLVKPCFPTAPTGSVTLPTAIDTDVPATCSTAVTDADGYCVIAADIIRVDDTVTVVGGKPLVLVANTTITVAATLDVASHRNLALPFATVQIGAGADPAGACMAGTLPGNNSGGAGGTLIGGGGTGGNGTGIGGVPGSAQTITTLRGGCRGQNGVSGTIGQGGRGGGAVYLIAKTAINITGAINASGEGGHPGFNGDAGGGGGGSGGMIGLDAPMITNTGVVFANGGSGGEGSGTTNRGNPGPEPNSAAPSPAPLSNSGSGGEGGTGGAGGTAGGNIGGGNALNGVGGGGGGGGGGAGVIKVFRTTLGGQHSPPSS